MPPVSFSMISSETNPRVRRIRRLQSSRRVRLNDARFVVEGPRLLVEGLSAGYIPELLFFTEEWAADSDNQALLNQEDLEGVQSFQVTAKVMELCSDTETPQGVLAVFPLPIVPPTDEPSLMLILDGIATPGNAGTLLRSAAAARVDLVLFAPGTVDPFNPKVVRGGMGAHFRLPIQRATWHRIEAMVMSTQCWLAEAEVGKSCYQVDWNKPTTLIIGGETKGLSYNARSLTSDSVHIPMPGGSESLNAAVAGSVILFEIVHQRAQG
ncbi:MAG: RNA methyltransferase [Chloroflexota bacterium]